MIKFDASTLDFDKGGGLICAVAQDRLTLQVLMVAWMDRAALEETLASGEATFFSRSRQARWRKGETSGNRLAVKQLLVDCDDDTVLVKAAREGDGNVCHTGARTCFNTEVTDWTEAAR